MQQALNFLPDPQGQGSFRPTFFPTLRTGSRFFLGGALAGGDGGVLGLADVARRPGLPASCDSAWSWMVWARSSCQREPRWCRNSGSNCSTRKIEVGDAVADAGPHLGEDPHSLALVLDLGIDLGVALQADRAAQVVHGAEVFHPARVEDLQQDGLFHFAHLGPVLGVEGD